MLIAVMVLFALYLTSTPKGGSIPKRILKKARVSKEVANRLNQQKINNRSADEKPDCAHYFGYLKSRKEKSVPEECVGCAMLVKCMFSEE